MSYAIVFIERQGSDVSIVEEPVTTKPCFFFFVFFFLKSITRCLPNFETSKIPSFSALLGLRASLFNLPVYNRMEAKEYPSSSGTISLA